MKLIVFLFAHLKLGPVHAHARSVGVPPPSEIFSFVGSLDGLTQVPVQVFEAGGKAAVSYRTLLSAQLYLMLCLTKFH